MLGALTLIIGLQVFGTLLAEVLALPVPGPVLGMLLFLLVLAVSARQPPALEQVNNFFLANLSLLFVPAAVGIVSHLGLVTPIIGRLLLVLVLSLLAGLVVSAWVFARVADRFTPAQDEENLP
ncbi:CidA/LrgA family protein [Marinobacterium rhizophilum]|uniref:CidA/LrgA family protein n=1 Tax=Marinobacterium rhizophilum TaxID=420402 RepID=A0ABY5HLH4_9GAMM|nr:CidA/LrgA family protein [Marinobacterium rhizophilum]UTW13230.1 CidA/LrgA family protein [Marinobacterium rhizophilum]